MYLTPSLNETNHDSPSTLKQHVVSNYPNGISPIRL